MLKVKHAARKEIPQVLEVGVSESILGRQSFFGIIGT